ncbi:MAG: hypothetical protein NVSMB51_21670 [Solirubrobacteraceae bacterium]
MKLEQLQDHWEAFGRTDPLWAILTDPDKRGNGWELEEFLATGRQEIAQAMAMLERDEVRFERRRALDFGCGVGRLTQALAEHFEQCDGVDIARSMVERARQLNRFGERVAYHLNEAADLSLFADASFDFVLSLIVLQHMEPRYMEDYLLEFMRVLRPGGVALLQIPAALNATAPEVLALAPVGRRAAIEPAGLPARLQVGERSVLQVTVCNASPVAWPAGLRLGNHWRGPVSVADDGRVELPALGPGDAAQVSLEVRAPLVSGEYELELDVIHEHVAWFAAAGSPTSVAPVTVAPAAGPEPEGPVSAPVMEMYALPVDRVLEVLGVGGGEVLARHEIDACGGGIQSFHYVVRR